MEYSRNFIRTLAILRFCNGEWVYVMRLQPDEWGGRASNYARSDIGSDWVISAGKEVSWLGQCAPVRQRTMSSSTGPSSSRGDAVAGSGQEIHTYTRNASSSFHALRSRAHTHTPNGGDTRQQNLGKVKTLRESRHTLINIARAHANAGARVCDLVYNSNVIAPARRHCECECECELTRAHVHFSLIWNIVFAYCAVTCNDFFGLTSR